MEKNKLLNMDIENQKNIADKIQQLSDSLEKSSELMKEIESDFEQQRILAEKWKDEAETYQSIAQLNQDEVNAVRKIFGQQINLENRRNIRFSIFLGALFCIIGIVGGLLLSALIL